MLTISELRTRHVTRRCHRTLANAPALTPARRSGTRFTYPEGIEG